MLKESDEPERDVQMTSHNQQQINSLENSQNNNNNNNTSNSVQKDSSDYCNLSSSSNKKKVINQYHKSLICSQHKLPIEYIVIRANYLYHYQICCTKCLVKNAAQNPQSLCVDYSKENKKQSNQMYLINSPAYKSIFTMHFEINEILTDYSISFKKLVIIFEKSLRLLKDVVLQLNYSSLKRDTILCMQKMYYNLKNISVEHMVMMGMDVNSFHTDLQTDSTENSLLKKAITFDSIHRCMNFLLNEDKQWEEQERQIERFINTQFEGYQNVWKRYLDKGDEYDSSIENHNSKDLINTSSKDCNKSQENENEEEEEEYDEDEEIITEKKNVKQLKISDFYQRFSKIEEGNQQTDSSEQKINTLDVDNNQVIQNSICTSLSNQKDFFLKLKILNNNKNEPQQSTNTKNTAKLTVLKALLVQNPTDAQFNKFNNPLLYDYQFYDIFHINFFSFVNQSPVNWNKKISIQEEFTSKEAALIHNLHQQIKILFLEKFDRAKTSLIAQTKSYLEGQNQETTPKSSEFTLLKNNDQIKNEQNNTTQTSESFQFQNCNIEGNSDYKLQNAQCIDIQDIPNGNQLTQMNENNQSSNQREDNHSNLYQFQNNINLNSCDNNNLSNHQQSQQLQQSQEVQQHCNKNSNLQLELSNNPQSIQTTKTSLKNICQMKDEYLNSSNPTFKENSTFCDEEEKQIDNQRVSQQQCNLKMKQSIRDKETIDKAQKSETNVYLQKPLQTVIEIQKNQLAQNENNNTLLQQNCSSNICGQSDQSISDKQSKSITDSENRLQLKEKQINNDDDEEEIQFQSRQTDERSTTMYDNKTCEEIKQQLSGRKGKEKFSMMDLSCKTADDVEIVNHGKAFNCRNVSYFDFNERYGIFYSMTDICLMYLFDFEQKRIAQQILLKEITQREHNQIIIVKVSAKEIAVWQEDRFFEVIIFNMYTRKYYKFRIATQKSFSIDELGQNEGEMNMFSIFQGSTIGIQLNSKLFMINYKQRKIVRIYNLSTPRSSAQQLNLLQYLQSHHIQINQDTHNLNSQITTYNDPLQNTYNQFNLTNQYSTQLINSNPPNNNISHLQNLQMLANNLTESSDSEESGWGDQDYPNQFRSFESLEQESLVEQFEDFKLVINKKKKFSELEKCGHQNFSSIAECVICQDNYKWVLKPRYYLYMRSDQGIWQMNLHNGSMHEWAQADNSQVVQQRFFPISENKWFYYKDTIDEQWIIVYNNQLQHGEYLSLKMMEFDRPILNKYWPLLNINNKLVFFDFRKEEFHTRTFDPATIVQDYSQNLSESLGEGSDDSKSDEIDKIDNYAHVKTCGKYLVFILSEGDIYYIK